MTWEISIGRNRLLKSMAAKGIIKGVSATEFRPGSSVSRADFAVLLVRTMDLRERKARRFPMFGRCVLCRVIAVLRGMGIAEGTGNNQFRPGEAIRDKI